MGVGMDKRITKYAFLVCILLITIMINIIIFYRPISISSDQSLIEKIPAIFWTLLIIISSLLFFVSIKTSSRYVAIFCGVMFFFAFYSYSLFFRVVSVQTDIGSISTYMAVAEEYNYLDTDLISYFEYPIFFAYQFMIKDLLGLSVISGINIGFFSLLLVIPITFALIIHWRQKENSFLYFLAPVSYLLLTYFFLNDQFVPQFMGLIFLIILSGLYIQFQNTNNQIYLGLTYFIYIILVFTHPFMFIFFIIAIFLVKLRLIIGINQMMREKVKEFSRHDSIFVFLISEINIIRSTIMKLLTETRRIIISIFKLEEISLTILILFYLYSYYFHFKLMSTELSRLFTSFGERGGSWTIISFIVGDEQSVGLIGYSTYPLFDLVDKQTYLLSRYSILLIILLLVISIFISFIKTSKKDILSFDILNSAGSISYFIIGFLFPHLLGQRTFQATFITITKYYRGLFQKVNLLGVIISTILIISPVFYIINTNINESISGYKFIEDDATLRSNKIIDLHVPDNTIVLTTDRYFSFYSRDIEYYSSDNSSLRVNPIMIVEEYEIEYSIDIIQYSPKLVNRVRYFGLDDNFSDDGYSIVYDQGDSKLLQTDITNRYAVYE